MESIFKSEVKQTILEKKMDYFYTPYQKTTVTVPFMKLDLGQKPQESLWKNVTENVLSSTEGEFRNFLKSINQNIHEDLFRIGKRYCNRVLAKNSDGDADLENNGSNPIMKRGIHLLRQVINEKILKNHKNCETPVVESRKLSIRSPFKHHSRCKSPKISPKRVKKFKITPRVVLTSSSNSPIKAMKI